MCLLTFSLPLFLCAVSLYFLFLLEVCVCSAVFLSSVCPDTAHVIARFLTHAEQFPYFLDIMSLLSDISVSMIVYVRALLVLYYGSS